MEEDQHEDKLFGDSFNKSYEQRLSGGNEVISNDEHIAKNDG